MSAPELTAASPEDLDAVLALLRQCGMLETGVPEALDRFVVARAGVALVGCAGLEIHANVGLLRSVAVEASAQKSGVGTELVHAVVRLARREGLSEVFLLTTTAPAFFTRLGFQPRQRDAVPSSVAGSWEFRVGCPDTAVVMSLPLQQSERG